MRTSVYAMFVGIGLIVLSTSVFAAAPPVPFADFEEGTNGWWIEEQAFDLLWTDFPDETAGPASHGAITHGINPDLPDDGSPESKVQGRLPDGINMGDYQYISFYYKCDNPAYTGDTMYIMPMSNEWSAGAGASHTGTMIADNKWHYEEYHRDEFVNWWGSWAWENTIYLVIGVWETKERGACYMWYDHVMLFNNPGDGILLAASGPPEVTTTTPRSEGAVSVLNEIKITFNQEVQGIATDGSDLRVNGNPATAVSTDDNRHFTFSGFPQPEVGTVTVEVLPGSIKSLSGDAFAGFSYSFERFAVKTYNAPFTSVPPTLDGVIHDGEYPGLFVNDWRPNLGTQNPTGPTDWDGEWAAAHDSDYLYVAFRATDDIRQAAGNPWDADNLELFVDGPNHKSGTGTQFRANWDGTSWVSSANENWEWAAGDTGGTTWIIEARFPKASLNIPEHGMIGFNVQPSDNDDGTRGMYRFWETSPINNNPWNDAAAWGNMILEANLLSGVADWSIYK